MMALSFFRRLLDPCWWGQIGDASVVGNAPLWTECGVLPQRGKKCGALCRRRRRAQEVHPHFTRGHLYVSGFVGSNTMEDAWIWPQVAVWFDGVRVLAKVTKRYPHTAYTVFACSLHVERTYLLRVSKKAGPLLAPVEKVIREEFLLMLLGCQVLLDDDQRTLMSLAAKHGSVVATESLRKASEEI